MAVYSIGEYKSGEAKRLLLPRSNTISVSPTSTVVLLARHGRARRDDSMTHFFVNVWHFID